MNSVLSELLDKIAGLRVIVIGEAMLDGYLTGECDRPVPDASVPVLNVTQQQQVPGGAANTAVNIHTLGGCVTFLSAVGDDWCGQTLRHLLELRGISTKHILTQPGRQTLSKQRLMADRELLIRFDQGSTAAIDQQTQLALIEQLTSSFADCDALIVSDYGYGILTPGVIAAIASLQNTYPRVIVVDSKDLTAYRSLNVTAVKPNYNQAIELLGIEKLSQSQSRSEQIAAYRQQLLELTGAQTVAVTLDSEGAIVMMRTSSSAYRTASVKASPNGTSGAGDTYISALTLALAAKLSVADAADLAAAAAAIAVTKSGTTPCSIHELRDFLNTHSEVTIQKSEDNQKSKIENPKSPHPSSLTSNEKYLPSLSELSDCITFYRAQGLRIVFTNGCFDILHAGHVFYLNQARAKGDILIIGVNSDISVSRLKGASRPINPLLDRIQVLAALSCVDRLISFDEHTPIDLIRLIRPDVYIKGGDYTKATLPEASVVEELGGVVEILPFVENRSTTSIIKRICQANLETKE